MRSVVLSFTCVLCLLFAVLIHATINDYSVREAELQDGLSVAMKQTMKEYEMAGGYGIVDPTSFDAALVRSLLIKMNSNGDVKVQILKRDLENGMLDVKVTESYSTLLGKKREISLRRTLIVEEPD